jgi:hypothetical protein
MIELFDPDIPVLDQRESRTIRRQRNILEVRGSHGRVDDLDRAIAGDADNLIEPRPT